MGMYHNYNNLSQLILQLRPAIDISDNQLYEFCRINRDLRIERTAEGKLLIMSPTGGETSRQNVKLVVALENWAEKDGSGIVTESSGGFILPNGAMRAPDAAWTKRSRYCKLGDEERRKFLPLCPDFVAEIRSPSDQLAALEKKMAEYIANVVSLWWLVDPDAGVVYVYRHGRPVERFETPTAVSGEEILPGFEFHPKKLWDLAV